ncbi:LuxR C-terminal-related transcriptional regulator [Shewanella sp. TC10]|uniref:LuxR C-terminal-related transcriptional regulator n=1 Tax=Shewanella sp. TC10 TaxID=1419739 RepID=UPI00129E34AC|nr:LuxR C-terminal-related transcriptional regulator [Shewanella sp. TC10]
MSNANLRIINDEPDKAKNQRVLWLESCLEEIATEFGFIGATYLLFFSDKVKYSESLLAKPVTYKKQHKMNNFLFSNKRMKQLRRDYEQLAIHHDPNIQNGLSNSPFKIFSYEGDDKSSKICRSVLDKYGVSTRLVCRCDYEDQPAFKGCFLLMSSESKEELSNRLAEIKPQIEQKIQHFHKVAVSSTAAPEINPIIGLGLISSKGRSVLELVAEGFNRIDIAERLFLTERGVDYHLNKLKYLFNAKTNAQLVSSAYKFKVLS